MKKSIFSQPINRLVVGSIIIVTLIPLGILGATIYVAAWENAWREIHEKHRLLAMNLASPIQHFVYDKQRHLGLLGTSLQDTVQYGIDNQIVGKKLKDAKRYLKDFDIVTVVDSTGRTRALISSHADDQAPIKFETLFATNPLFLQAIESHKSAISGVLRSVISDRPTVLMAEPITIRDEVKAVLMAEMSLVEIEKLRKNIKFGLGGHSAMVDQFGKVIAHPNPQWAQEIKDISHIDIVKRMMAGETGVMEFYSPFVKMTMVAGYTSVPGLNWGVMVPQPKIEVENQVSAILYHQFGYAGFGLLIAIGFAILISKKIIAPLNHLAVSARSLITNNYEGSIPEIADTAPREIVELSAALTNLVDGLQYSRTEINQLNKGLTDRVEEATSQLRESNEKLESAAIEADKANSAKSRFLAGMSHELRTPLNAIIGYTEMLYEEASDSGYLNMKPDLQKVSSSAKHLLSLINDILDLSKIEAGKMELSIETFDVAELLKDIEATIDPLVRKNNNILQVQYEGALGLMRTDSTKLQQILLNLLSNAAKFTENGIVSLLVSRFEDQNHEWLQFVVKDTGMGISHEQLSKLFKPFSQTDEVAGNSKYGGTGLGLTITRYFSELMGGDVSVESAPGEGSSFAIVLPAYFQHEINGDGPDQTMQDVSGLNY